MNGDAVGSQRAGTLAHYRTDVEHVLDHGRRVDDVEEVGLERDGITVGVYGECRCVAGRRSREAEPLPVIVRPVGNIIVNVKAVGVEAEFPQSTVLSPRLFSAVIG
jgi:hypothetical protein